MVILPFIVYYLPVLYTDLSISIYLPIYQSIYLSVCPSSYTPAFCLPYSLHPCDRGTIFLILLAKKEKQRERDLEKRSNVLRAYCRHLVVLGVWALHSNPATGKAWAPATRLHCLLVLYPVAWTSSPPLLLGESKPSFQPFPLCHARLLTCR